MDYIKLSQLVNTEFKINKVGGFSWKSWDNENKKMLISDTFQKGYKKVYRLETDKGVLDISENQLGQIATCYMRDGKVDLNGKSISVKSNGQTGMDIRYFFNPVKEQQADTVAPVDDNTDILEELAALGM